MKSNLCRSINDCAKTFSLLDFGLLHFCVGSAGAIAGMLVPKKSKKHAFAATSIIFSLTLLPLMIKFVRIVVSQEK